MRRSASVVSTVALACVLAAPAWAQSTQAQTSQGGNAQARSGDYKLVTTIDLPGNKGGHGDWTTFDPQTRTVWLSQSPDHNVVVIDAATNKVKGVISGIENGNGIALTPQYAFLSDNKSGETVIVDKQSFKKIGSVRAAGKGPNGTDYVPSTDTVYVSADSNDMTAFQAKPPFKEETHFRLQPDPSKDGPDVGLYVPSKNMLYQPDQTDVDVINPQDNKIVAVWHFDIKGSTKPIVYDTKTNHFVLGTTDKKMLVLDGNTGKEIGSIPVEGAVDETVIDEGARRAYVADKAGVIEVIDLDSNKVVDRIPSEKNAHTLAVDPQTHMLYIYLNEGNKVAVWAMSKTM